jgi:hypothetical protein
MLTKLPPTAAQVSQRLPYRGRIPTHNAHNFNPLDGAPETSAGGGSTRRQDDHIILEVAPDPSQLRP